jgi:Protein of unknown function (DUF1593)
MSTARAFPVAICLAIAALLTAARCAGASNDAGHNHRLVVLADMGNEPDEEQQMVHLLMYANEIDIEGLIAVTGKYLRNEPRPDLFHRLIDGYQEVEENLRRNADGWPAAEELRRVVAAGQQHYGIDDTGDGKSSPGSRLILKAATNDDPRSLHIVVNAGANTLAQALVDYRSSHSAEETDALIAKLRVFENGSQDNAGAWIAHEFPKLHWIRSNYQTYCYGGPGFDGNPKNNNVLGPYTWEPYDYSPLGQHHWALEHIIANHGRLGRLYPIRMFHRGELVYLEGGGTIPWMGLVHKGVYHPDHPYWGSFSGRFTKNEVKNYWSRHPDIRADEKQYGDFSVFAEASDRWTNPEDGKELENEYVPVWRWRRAMFNDIRARMDWCIKKPTECNHNPVAVIDGDASQSVVYRNVAAGDSIALDGSSSHDPDRDALRFRWFVYPEAGSFAGEITIVGAAEGNCRFTIPDSAAGKEIHVIFEVADQHSGCPLYDFRRIVLSVAR